jgi:hypothetical protein
VDAFSTGKDVFFARGAFNQSDPASRGLLAHELSHSMQQGVGGDSSAVSQSAPVGEAQGGLLDWFRNLFKRKKQPQPEPQPASRNFRVTSSAPSDDPDALRYMREVHKIEKPLYDRAIPAFNQTIEDTAMPQAVLGKRGTADKLGAFRGVLEEKDSRGMSPIEKSNQAFREKEGKGNPISNALVALRLRSNDSVYRAMEGVRGSLFSNLPEDYATYADSLRKRGVDFRMLDRELAKEDDSGNQVNKYTFNSGKPFYMNDSLQKLSSKMLSQFGSYATSDDATTYFRDMADQMSDIDIFNSPDGKNVLDTLTEDLFLRYGVKFTGVTKREAARNQTREAGMESSVFAKVSGTLMNVPKIANLSTEEREQLPPQMLMLFNQYEALVEQIKQNVAALKNAQKA